ncbi:CheR family methyltransferase [Vibrio ulleungensis]|uniref:CheR-type methyltransferase domain-containing protein n=1 Tax=Vibrio ulleungensis TaxID=2807619 RepID=A0ABS2HL89_9VIBR|nr:CheR family methyltransferase [Vibrio ulleungensis]MBM7037809.1 hypothetical protein [Vibrio ulleungensis]
MSENEVNSAIASSWLDEPLSEEKNIEMSLLLTVLDEHFGYSFRYYSKNSLARSFARACSKFGLEHMSDLIPILLHQPRRLDEVIDAITVNYTQLYREPKSWLSFAQSILPRLYSYPSLNIWIAGCSTGEEIYSLMILLDEHNLLGRSNITATDINPWVLETAASGVLSQSLNQKDRDAYQQSGGKENLDDYFVGGRELITPLKRSLESVTFKVHDLCQGPPMEGMHLVLCRNVLIYFTREKQKQVVMDLENSLVPLGYCCLGQKERFMQHQGGLKPLVETQGWYKRFR